LAWAWANQDVDEEDKQGRMQTDDNCDSDDDADNVPESKSDGEESTSQIKKHQPQKPGQEARVRIGGYDSRTPVDC
jgi:hypothetical protein